MMKNIGKPCAGKLHARFDEGRVLRHLPTLPNARDTTPEMEEKLVKEMYQWAAENSYVGWFNDCRDFTEHFQQRARDLMEVERVKNGQMGLGSHIGSRLGRHLSPNRHNRL
jgi:hypothetical protein